MAKNSYRLVAVLRDPVDRVTPIVREWTVTGDHVSVAHCRKALLAYGQAPEHDLLGYSIVDQERHAVIEMADV